MADPRKPYRLNVTSSSSGSAAGHTVKVTNLSTGDTATGTLDSNKKLNFDLANLSSEYSNADIIVINQVGTNIGGNSHTVDTTSSGQNVTLTTSANALPTISM